jgi:glycosyltransferase involved in cell wall biosynthesis
LNPAALRVTLEMTGLELDAGGSARAIAALRSELERRDDVELVTLAHRGQPGHGWRRLLRGLHRELVYMPIQLPRRAAKAGADLLHCPVGVASTRARVPLVVTVNDVMALEHPGWFTRANALQQRLVLPRALAAAARVIVPSQYTLERVLATCRVDAAKVDVVPYGVGSIFAPGPPDWAALERLGVESPYVLAVGTLQPRKNIPAAVAAFERVTAEGSPHGLVVAGPRGWRDDALAGMLRKPRIHLLGAVTDEQLVELYRGADCLVFPSLYEGFGFPVLEAMACGTPVVCADRTSLPEVAGEAAVLVDPDDTAAFAAALAEVLSSPARRAELADAGIARAREFSWRRCADLTVAAYRRALDPEVGTRGARDISG